MTTTHQFRFRASATLTRREGDVCELVFSYPYGREAVTRTGPYDQMEALMYELANWHVMDSQADLVRCEMD